MNKSFSVARTRYQVYISSILLVLLIPLLGTIFSNEVNWDLADFIIMTFLLGMTVLSVEFIFRKIHHKNTRRLLMILSFLILLLVWAELGVGIIGTPFAGN